MKALLAVLLPAFTAAGLALADGPEPENAAAARLRRLQRDRALIEKLIDGGLKLAEEEDPLKRADHCARLAEGLTQEIQQAVTAKDGRRAGALSHHLQALLTRGVAANLSTARGLGADDSPRAQAVRRLGEEVVAVMLPLEQKLAEVPDAEQERVRPVQEAVRAGRAEVEKAAAVPRPSTSKRKGPSLKAPPAGKKVKSLSR